MSDEKRLGTVVTTKSGLLQGIITLVDGSRKRLKPFPKGTSKEMAREKTHVRALQARELGAKKHVPAGAPSDAERWWDNFFAARDARGLSPVRFLYTTHIKPVQGEKHPRDYTREDCERQVATLDEKIARGDMSWKTAANAWGLFTKALKVASSAKSGSLRVRRDNPCIGVEPPNRGEAKVKQWLYPTEFAKLAACSDVPLRWRRMYALLAYTYVRPNELRALDWQDVDLDVGTIHICKAWDEKRGRLKVPKTAAGVRYVPIEPALLPMLKAIRPASGQGPLLQMGPMEDWAERFRRHLHLAEVARPELFADNETHKQITLYDLRATGITWRCLRQDYGPAIQQAAGHEKYDTTDGYIRTAAVFVGRVGEPFPTLPPELLSSPSDHPKRSPKTQVVDFIATPAGIEPALPA
ncbi:MAG: site-specific integrase [Myxococcota bacterium]